MHTGFGRSASSDAQTYSANAPKPPKPFLDRSPKTALPGRNRVTFGPTASMVPATSHPPIRTRRRVRERPHHPADDSERQRRVHYEEIVIVDRGRAHPDEDLTVLRNRNGDVSDLRRALLAANHSFHEG